MLGVGGNQDKTFLEIVPRHGLDPSTFECCVGQGRLGGSAG